MSTSAEIPYRPLGIVKSVLEEAGFSVSHCYEDLVFVNHNAFILRMEEKGCDVSLLYNVESEEDSRAELTEKLQGLGKESDLCIVQKGLYRLVPDEKNQTISIEIMEEPL